MRDLNAELRGNFLLLIGLLVALFIIVGLMFARFRTEPLTEIRPANQAVGEAGRGG